jgi:hypothetical protein
MPTLSKGTIIACVAISAVSLFVWLVLLMTLSDLGHSDAAGNAITEAFAGFEIILLWILLAVLLLVSGIAGGIWWLNGLTALILLPASGFAAAIALDLLAASGTPPFLWPIVTPALVPPIVVVFSFWSFLPALRTRIRARIAAPVTWCATLLLCVVLLPMQQSRQHHEQQLAAQSAKWETDFARLPADAPLWAWTPFLDTRNDIRQGDVLNGIRKLGHRQEEAEIMLDRGDFPLGFLGAMDLDPTPSLCNKARALLRQRVQPLMSPAPGSRPYADVAEQVADALAAMRWLVGYGCSCDAELQAWIAMANGYKDTNFDVVELQELREPNALGETLRQQPDKFSMLTPQSHLRAWLKFADDKENGSEALAGARKLDHRQADAMEMLHGEESDAASVLIYLPELDLDATEAVCTASLGLLHEKFAKVYHPRPDDRRSYDELLSRLYGEWSLNTLQWLATHGCNADAQLDEAEELVRGYQDSPARAVMLTRLEHAHHKS